MTLEQWLAVIGVALAFGGLVPSLRGGPDRRLIIIAIILSLILALTSVMVLLAWRHDQKIRSVEGEMLSFLSTRQGGATFEEIFKNLDDMEESDAREALLKSRKAGKIRHYELEINVADGNVVELRYYQLNQN